MSWSCFENINIPSCVWFQGGENRNTIAALVSGILVSNNFLKVICN